MQTLEKGKRKKLYISNLKVWNCEELFIHGCFRNKLQGSHFFGLTKFHDISMIFPGFLVNFQVFFSLFLKYDFQVVLNINMQTYWVSFEQKINHFNYTPN